VFTVSYFDAKEHRALFEETKKNKKKEVSPKSPNVDKDCRELQEKLYKAEYLDKDYIDGKPGPKTTNAKNNFDADKDKTDEIARLEKIGWDKNKPKFGNIDPVKFNGVIPDEIKGFLLKKVDDKTFNFQLPRKKDVVLYRSSIKVEDVNREIKSINKQIIKNDKIVEVSFAIEKEALSYPLIVDGVLIGYYNYKEKEDSKDSNKNKAKESKNQEEEEDTKEVNKEKGKNKEDKSDQDQEDSTDVVESPEETTPEPNKSNY
jgi:hypothetical protein